LKASSPVLMLLPKAFQIPEFPRARLEAEVLLEAGYPVYVIAWDRNQEFPTLENVGGVVVRSIRFLNLSNFSRLGLAVGGIALQVLLLFETLKLINQLKQRPIIHAHDVNTYLIGCLVRRLRLCGALIYDCREFTYGVYCEWFNAFVGSLVRVVEERCLRYADAVVTVNDSIRAYLCRFNAATETIYNCPRIKELPKISKKEARIRLCLAPHDLVVSFVGSIRYGCRFDLLLDAASATKEQNINYIVVGDGPLAHELKLAVRRAGDLRVRIMPSVIREVALLYVVASDLTWEVYGTGSRPTANSRAGLSWKFLESLACGVPVIVERETVRANLVRQFNCGLVLEGDDPNQVAQTILSLANHRDDLHRMSLEAKRAWERLDLNWESMSVRLLAIYERIRCPS